MSSIIDLLGDQLRAGPAQLVDPDASDAAPASLKNATETAQDYTHEAAMETVLDETDLDPTDAHGKFALRDDLDMDDASLYTVVACVEREARVALSDSQIEQRATFADLLDAVSDITSDYQRKTLPVELQRHSQCS